MDLLNAFQKDLGSLGSRTTASFLPPPLFLLRIGLSSLFRTLLKPDPRRCRPCWTWAATACTGGGGRSGTGGSWAVEVLGTVGSERLRPSRMAWFNWTSNECLSNRSNSALCSSPNLFRITSTLSLSIFFLVFTTNE